MLSCAAARACNPSSEVSFSSFNIQLNLLLQGHTRVHLSSGPGSGSNAQRTVCVAPSLNFPPTFKKTTEALLSIETHCRRHQRRESVQRGGEDGGRNPAPPKSTPGWVCFSFVDSSQQLSGSILLLIFGHPHIACSQIQLDGKEHEQQTFNAASFLL